MNYCFERNYSLGVINTHGKYYKLSVNYKSTLFLITEKKILKIRTLREIFSFLKKKFKVLAHKEN